MTAYDAVVLAGGRARRLGGVDKPGLVVGGRALLDRVLDAVADAASTVVVGPARPTTRPVRWALEEPPGGGPAAALAAGLPLGRAPWVAVLAADLPLLRAGDVQLLRERAAGGDGAVLLDGDGRPQWLAGVWRRSALSRLELAPGGSVGRALASLAPAGVSTAAAPVWLDCDTPADVVRAEGLL